MVTVYKHKDKPRYVTIHVDGLLVVGPFDECHWFGAELPKTFTGKSEGPYNVDDHWECPYFKTNFVCAEQGIVVYIPRLLELLKIVNRRVKSPPRHSKLETYTADRILNSEKVSEAGSKCFRGGVGLCLNLAQDRPITNKALRLCHVVW